MQALLRWDLEGSFQAKHLDADRLTGSGGVTKFGVQILLCGAGKAKPAPYGPS